MSRVLKVAEPSPTTEPEQPKRRVPSPAEVDLLRNVREIVQAFANGEPTMRERKDMRDRLRMAADRFMDGQIAGRVR